MIMNEPTQDAIRVLKSKVEDQLGIKVDSCVFLVLGTKKGEIITHKTPCTTASIHDIPEHLDNAAHDLTLMNQMLELARQREHARRGFGFIQGNLPDQ